MTPYLLSHYLALAAEARPDARAVEDGAGGSITYRDLDERSSRLANLLVALGVGRGDRVALCLTKSIESIVTVYGIMKAGAAYVPLDPNAPEARLATVATDCDTRWIVTDPEHLESSSTVLAPAAGLQHVIVDSPPPGEGVEAKGWPMIHHIDAVGDQPSTAPVVRLIDDDLAYILYTSGSTGRPKGVMLSHRNAIAFVGWAARTFALYGDDRVSNHAPLHFDLSVFDVFGAAAASATLILVPPNVSLFPREAARFLAEQRISVWYSVPSILSMLTLRGGLTPGDLPDLRTILFAGEVFPTKYLRRLMAVLPHTRFANLYGPTETNVCTWYDVVEPPPDDADDIPIGIPIDNDDVVVVGAADEPVAAGEEGELLVRGATVMQGYWGDTQKTAASLVPDPESPNGRGVMYRTGDLVRQQPDGNLRFLGRRDTQVKSRGYRIELGEIETVINAHDGVIESAVIAVADELVGTRIRCHVVCRAEVTASEIAAYCSTRLPNYMIPEFFELRDSLPRTSNGKVDRQALAEHALTLAASKPGGAGDAP